VERPARRFHENTSEYHLPRRSTLPALLQFLPSAFKYDPREYASGADEFDNAITQLLNQWESPKSPPASKEEIDNNLAVVTTAQEHIDSERQYSVRMGDFQLGAAVRSLRGITYFIPTASIHGCICTILARYAGRGWEHKRMRWKK